mmetsp:Transcript_70857/g.195731  ORF Transcript_70857/g.195731 Transcript_70857/m.195731 type:complete len:238 (+) Transcript_70857:294-1007(+)
MQEQRVSARHGLVQPLKLPLHVAREFRKLPCNPSVVVHECRQVGGLGRALQAHAAPDELFDVNGTCLVDVDQLKQAPCVLGVDLQSVEVGLKVVIRHDRFELLKRDLPRRVQVHVLEQPPDLVHEVLLVGEQRLHHQVRVALGGFDGAVAEDAGHDVEHGEDREEDECDEEQREDHGDIAQRCRDVVPIDPAGDRLEERQHGIGDSSPEGLQGGIKLDLLVHVVCGSLGEDDAEDVH